VLAFGLRTVLQLQRTGSSGFKGISGRTGSAEWTGGVLFVFAFGLALLVPNVVALAAFLALVAALELQVRLVEEPYLMRTHGKGYLLYASRVGRFVPGVGKLKARSEPSWLS
jgi:hypothetical protein